MQCNQCGSNDLKKISDKKVKCNHCGSVIYLQERKLAGNLLSNKVFRFIIILSVFLLTTVIVGYLIVNLLTSFQTKSEQGEVKSNSRSKAVSSKNVQNLPEPSGRFTRVSQVNDTIGNIYFLGIYENTGDTPIRKPDISISLYSTNGKELASGRGFGMHNYLLPKEKTPVKILIQNAPEFDHFKIHQKAEHPFIKRSTQGKVKIENDIMKEDRYFYNFTARVVNKETVPLKYIRIGIVLYNQEKKIIGIQTTYVKKKELDPAEESVIQTKIYGLMEKPAFYEMFTTSIK